MLTDSFIFFRLGDSKVGGDEGSEVQTHDCPFVGRYQALVPSVVLHVQYQDLVYVTKPIFKFEVHLSQVKFVDEREGQTVFFLHEFKHTNLQVSSGDYHQLYGATDSHRAHYTVEL